MFRHLRIVAAVILIIGAGLLVYCNSFGGPFIFDDFGSIPNNPSIRQLWPIWEVAAAYAETGQFDQAVKTAKEALQLSRNVGEQKLARTIQNHLESYRVKRPWRE